ncbi:MAG: HAMP domain-containing protein [Planctomycetes bacterium]|nr:HAMP domain-containing protein [Planctomycetota bacterium]
MGAVEPRPARLATRLAGAILILAGATVVLLLAVLGPAASASVAARCATLVQGSSTRMLALAAEQTEASRQVLIDLITHTTDARQRTLADLPLSLHGGDVEKIRGEIRAQDAERAARLAQNVQVLAREMQRRTTHRIEGHVAELTREQLVRTEEFAADLRRAHLELAGGVFGVAILMLGVGLYRLVVRPVAALRAATRRIAGGDLDVAVQARGGGEIGALAADFATMVEQLRTSRAELTRLNRGLEQEVAGKTRHLEQALSELRATHTQLVQAEKMASIGTLAGGIAHEFHNLIGGIRGCTQELLHDAAQGARRETLEVILRATDRATGITQQLLRFAKRSVGQRRDVDLAAVLADALRLVEPEARRRGVAVRCAPPALPPLLADGDALHQVFLNLFTNALQAMPQGGTLTVTAEPAPAAAPRELVVRVADTGVGIAAGDLDRVFEPFFSRREGEGGSGLGLSVSYGIVAAHGGALTVESRPGAGTTFTVRLPLLPDDAH